MKQYLHTLILLSTGLLMACSADNALPEAPHEQKPVEEQGQQPVLFSSGGEAMNLTRAAAVTYMPEGIRFAVDMYAKTVESEDIYNFTTPEHGYMLVQGNMGNCVYRQSTYAEPSQLDENGNDPDATIFYWKSRNTHAFIGYVDDYHKALAATQGGGAAYIPKGMKDTPDESVVPDTDEPDNPDKAMHMRSYTINLKRESGMTSMQDQPDPLLAVTEKLPAASSAEQNRVYLTFRHQLAQVQVCLKGHESMGESFTADDITKVELLGVSEEARIYPFMVYNENCLYFDRVDRLLHPTEGVAVNLANYSAGELEKNPYGTSLTMFEGGTITEGYLKSYQCIAFGTLGAIRITWDERTGDTTLTHVVTFKITDSQFYQLQSGRRYVLNMELRRGTLAVIRTTIDDWKPYTTTYTGDGTIKDENE